MTTVREAANALMSVCDGARSNDHVGFNKVDSPIVTSICSQERWTVKQQRMVHFILGKYQRQLSNFGIEYTMLTFEPTREPTQKKEWKPAPEPSKLRITVDLRGTDIVVQHTYAEHLVDDMRNIPHGRWDGINKCRVFDGKFDDAIDGIRDFLVRRCDECECTITEAASEYIARRRAEREQHHAILQRVQDIKRDAIPTIPVPLKTTPFDNQVRAYIIGTTLDSSAFLMEQGTGKTLAAIAVAGKRFMDCQVKRMIVMCPLSVMYVWKNEFEQHADFPFSIRICHGNPKKRLAAFARSNPNELTVVVVNYDSVISRTRKERDEKGAVVKKVEIGGLADQIIAWKPDLVLLDESQRVKEPDSKRSKLVHRIGDATTYKMILTGTPVGNSPLDIWSQYRFLDVRIFGDNYYRFRDEYAVLREMRVRAGIDKYGNPIFRTIKVVDGYKNLGQMTEKVHSIAYRVTKDEALDLPPEIHQSIHCQLVASRPYYDAMKKDMAVEFCGMEVKANMVLPQIMRLAEITGGFLPMKKDGVQEIVQVGTEKMDALVDFITYFPTNKKLVIFCRFTPEINAIVERLKSMDITVEKIDGSVPDPKVRNDIIESFQHAQDPRVLVIQSQTGGLGITLHRADTIVFYSGNESLLDYEQAKARVQRYGQTGDKVTYVHIVAKGTIDEKIVAVLRAKKDLANIVVDELLDDDEDVYDRS